jgi:hypothetical protein
MGGILSWVLQYLTGFQQLGHDIYCVEKSGYPQSCYDPIHNQMTDSCEYGFGVVRELLSRFSLQDRFCYVDEQGTYHGLQRKEIEDVFRSADLFIEMGTHEAWLEEASLARMRILIDGDPGFSQIWMQQRLSAKEKIPRYDYYFTVGTHIGTDRSSAPTAGAQWHAFYQVVNTSLFPRETAAPEGPFTTVMNWQSYRPVEYNGAMYGHKNIEFERFIDLPLCTNENMELAIAGHDIPCERLAANRWQLRDAHAVTISFDSFADYIRNSKGEFTVCKNGFVAMHTGWFSERSAVYLSSGRPVVMQDTGFSEYLPCGKGLFAVNSVEEAVAAMQEISRDYDLHSKAARDVAVEYMDARKVLGSLLEQIHL